MSRTIVDVLGYPLSGIELAGTIAYLASVVLVARRNVLTWPVGIVAVILYASLFWQIRLYADALEQIYYLGASLAGWWGWSRARRDGDARIPVAWSNGRSILAVLTLTGAASLLAGEMLGHVHEWLPSVFLEPASLPRLDAATTVASLVAMALTARRRIESWLYWIAVDVAGIGVYAAKGILFVSALYVVLLALAWAGLRSWTRAGEA